VQLFQPLCYIRTMNSISQLKLSLLGDLRAR